jgi:dynein heavy chain
MTMIVDCSLAWVNKYATFPIHRMDLNLVDSFIKLLDSQLVLLGKDPARLPKDFDDVLSNFMLFAALWSFGAAIDETSRRKFSEFLLKLITADFSVVDNYQLTLVNPFKPFSIRAKLPDKAYLFDMCFVPQKGWISWTQTKPAYVIPKGGDYHEIKVPTSDSLRNEHLAILLISANHHLLLAGPTGTGKTSNVLALLASRYFNADETFLNTSFSGQTTANQIQRILESKINYRKRKGVFGPEDRKSKIVVFIDDLSMPIKEKYGAQPPIELLRQWMDMGGWYDLDTKEFKEMIGVTWVTAMLPPAGRSSLTNRYLRHFNLLYAQPF